MKYVEIIFVIFFFIFNLWNLACVLTFSADLNSDCSIIYVFILHLYPPSSKCEFCTRETYSREKWKPKAKQISIHSCKSHAAHSHCVSATGVEPKGQGFRQIGSCFISQPETEARKRPACRGTRCPVCGDKAAIMWNVSELQWDSPPHCKEETQMAKTSVHTTCSTYLRNVHGTWRGSRKTSEKTS